MPDESTWLPPSQVADGSSFQPAAVTWPWPWCLLCSALLCSAVLASSRCLLAERKSITWRRCPGADGDWSPRLLPQPQGQRLLSLRDGCTRCNLLSHPIIFLRAFVVLKLIIKKKKLQSGNRMQLMCPDSVLLTLLLSVCPQGSGRGRGGLVQ